MTPVRTLFLGTPDFAGPSLEALMKDPFYEVVGVITQPYSSLSLSSSFSARKKGKKRVHFIEKLVEDKEWTHFFPVFKPSSVNNEAFLKEIHVLEAKLVIVVAFGQILSSKFLHLFFGRVVNIHASLLPCWRGAAPIERALMSGESETGVSLQVIEEGLDTGPLLGERRVKVTDEKDAKALHDELKFLAQDLLHKELKSYVQGFLKAKPQIEFIKEGSRSISYAHKIKKSEAVIGWGDSAHHISCKIRALALHSGAISQRRGKRLKIHRAFPFMWEKSVFVETFLSSSSSNALSFLPGEVVRLEKESFWVSCGEGFLRVLEVQPESRVRMNVRDFLRGYSLELGERLG